MGNEGGSQAYKSSADIPKDILDTKPKNSPDVNKWYNKGGKISVDADGTWTYYDWEGNKVSYTDGYPDFKSAGMVNQEADIGPFQGRNKDFQTAKDLGYIKSDDGTWHHHQDGRTLQDVNTILHDRFRHRGGISKMKND